MKKTLLSVISAIGLSFASHASLPCITNVTVTSSCGQFQLQGGNPRVDPTAVYTSLTSMSLISATCGDQNAIAITFACDCASVDRICAIVSWECDASVCGSGGNHFDVNIPANCDAITIYIVQCSGGGCCLGDCYFNVRLCPTQVQ